MKIREIRVKVGRNAPPEVPYYRAIAEWGTAAGQFRVNCSTYRTYMTMRRSIKLLSNFRCGTIKIVWRSKRLLITGSV